MWWLKFSYRRLFDNLILPPLISYCSVTMSSNIPQPFTSISIPLEWARYPILCCGNRDPQTVSGLTLRKVYFSPLQNTVSCTLLKLQPNSLVTLQILLELITTAQGPANRSNLCHLPAGLCFCWEPNDQALNAGPTHCPLLPENKLGILGIRDCSHQRKREPDLGREVTDLKKKRAGEPEGTSRQPQLSGKHLPNLLSASRVPLWASRGSFQAHPKCQLF